MVKKIEKEVKKNMNKLEKISANMTNWIGTPYSILLHTILFMGIFVLYFFGIGIDSILLILTTVVSLEAIYLAIFIQMTVNKNTKSLEEVEEDIEEIQEDVEDLEEDLEVVQSEHILDDAQVLKTIAPVNKIKDNLHQLIKDLENLKRNNEKSI